MSTHNGQGPEPAQLTTLAADRLDGVAAIAEYCGYTERRCRYLIARGLLPVAKLGGLYIGSRRVLAEHYRTLTNPSATRA